MLYSLILPKKTIFKAFTTQDIARKLKNLAKLSMKGSKTEMMIHDQMSREFFVKCSVQQSNA